MAKHIKSRFKYGNEKTKVGFYVHDPILEALDKLAFERGIKKPDLITDILDLYLSGLVEAGELSPPATSKKNGAA